MRSLGHIVVVARDASRAFRLALLRSLLLGSLLLGSLLLACTTGVRLGVYDGGVPESCGASTCALGEVCCSPSCGLCVPMGSACIERSCGGPCDAFLASGSGTCRTSLGFVWNGNECVVIAGCACEGTDCSRLYETIEACQMDHSACVPPPLCLSDMDCTADQYCAYPMGLCGAPAGVTGTCTSRALESTCSTLRSPVCGCDNRTYGSYCEAQQNGVSVLFEGECGPVCIADDAQGSGDCVTPLGRAFDGYACVELVGCECVGADCAQVMSASCERAHDGCVMPPADLVCGDQLCYRASEYCVMVPSVTGIVGRCEAIPPSCTPASCGCLGVMGMCSDDGSAGITIVTS